MLHRSFESPPTDWREQVAGLRTWRRIGEDQRIDGIGAGRSSACLQPCSFHPYDLHFWIGPDEAFHRVEHVSYLPRCAGHGRKSELAALPLVLVAGFSRGNSEPGPAALHQAFDDRPFGLQGMAGRDTQIDGEGAGVDHTTSLPDICARWDSAGTSRHVLRRDGTRQAPMGRGGFRVAPSQQFEWGYEEGAGPVRCPRGSGGSGGSGQARVDPDDEPVEVVELPDGTAPLDDEGAQTPAWSGPWLSSGPPGPSVRPRQGSPFGRPAVGLVRASPCCVTIEAGGYGLPPTGTYTIMS